MVYKADHSDHDTAFTRLLQTVHENNVKLNFKKLQYKQTQVNFFGETYTTVNLWMLQFLISYFMALTLNIYIYSGCSGGFSIRSSSQVGEAMKHEINVATFGGHHFYDLFLQG